jgi:nucleotide-binding universal stress UspA family protein
MFAKILHANDGSDCAFKALSLAMDIAKQNGATLDMVCVEEIPSMPEYIEEVRQTTETAARRFHAVAERAHAMAERSQLNFKTHILAGHPVRIVTDLARELGADLLVIGATGHSALYERLIGSRADRIIQLAHCPVLVAK